MEATRTAFDDSALNGPDLEGFSLPGWIYRDAD